VFEAEPLDHDATLVLWGEGTKHPSPGLLGAGSKLVEHKLARRYVVDGGDATELPPHGLVALGAGQRLRTCPAGGGGVGDPFERPVEAVEADVRNGLVSAEAAREEYGVVVDDPDSTRELRGTPRTR
jgi:N-methylhydantoinase B